MKRIATFLFCWAALAAGAFAQPVALTHEDIIFDSGQDIEWILAKLDGLNAPVVGEDQTWDYTGLQQQSVQPPIELLRPPATDAFPDATTARAVALDYSAFRVSGFEYHRKSTDGLDYLGRVLEAVTADLSGQGDSVIVPEQVNAYAPAPRYLAFPMEYGQARRFEYGFETNLTLKIPNFGLPSAPGAVRSRIARADTVVGWGLLRLPGDAERKALLLKRHEVLRDSYFVAGVAAPNELIAPLGLRNGDSTTLFTYNFYVTGLPDAAVQLFMDSTWTRVRAAYYNANFVTARGSRPQRLRGVSLAPNPAAGVFRINGLNGRPAEVEARDMTGRIIARRSLNGDNPSLDLSAFPPALYAIKVRADGRTAVLQAAVVR